MPILKLPPPIWILAYALASDVDLRFGEVLVMTRHLDPWCVLPTPSPRLPDRENQYQARLGDDHRDPPTIGTIFAGISSNRGPSTDDQHRINERAVIGGTHAT